MSSNFIRDIIDEDLRTGRHTRIVTRFPPEPNGYLHIGHAKSIVLNFGIARDYGGQCNLRFDDTNPVKEDVEYVEAIKRDVRWLGYDWGDNLFFASDYFERMYELALQLIRDGKAYVDSLSDEDIKQYRGSLGVPGTPSPYRDRSVDENLDLFQRMRAGEFPDGAHVLRARIDLAASNMKMRDPLLYRIRHAHHHRTGDAWCIYPMYDYAHPLSDAFEGITHSLCTLEFENNRELYDWVVDNCDVPCKPRQIEFARLGLDYTVMSKRKLLRLVKDAYVAGWDDPRMPTLAGLRRRGYPPAAIRAFVDLVGVAKANSMVDLGKLEFSVRDHLNREAPRVMAVLDPLEVVLTNYPEGQAEELEAPYFPPDIGKPGSRKVPLSRRLLIERDDFMEQPSKGFRRLAPGRLVRLRYAYVIRCDEVIKDDAGRITQLRCSYLPETLGGASPEGEKVAGIVHWVSAEHALPAEVRLYDRLFHAARPDAEGDDFSAQLNPSSLVTLGAARVEPSVAADAPDQAYQFERQGYFTRDAVDSRPDRLVFNRIVELRDRFAGAAEVTAPAGAEPAPKASERAAGARSKTRPTKKTAAELRDKARAENPELQRRYVLYKETMGLADEEADLITGDIALASFFEAALHGYDNPPSVAKWVVNELLRALKDTSIGDLRFTGKDLGVLARLADEGTVSSAAAKEVFAHMMNEGGEPQRIVADKGLGQVSDASSIEPVVERVLAANPEQVARYRDGKTGLFGFFVGQVMKETRGKANPQLVQDLLQQKLS